MVAAAKLERLALEALAPFPLAAVPFTFDLLGAVDRDHAGKPALDGFQRSDVAVIGNPAGLSERGAREVVNLTEIIERLLPLLVAPARRGRSW